MNYYFRAFLLSLMAISLFVAPYSLLSYVCYGGLCFSPEIEEISTTTNYVTILGLYSWLYPVIAGFWLYSASKNPKQSNVFVLIPIICLIPFFYVTFNINEIYKKHANKELHQSKRISQHSLG